MAVSLLAASRQEQARARRYQLPPQPGTPRGTRLPEQTRPCPWVVQDISLMLPGPARPCSGSGSPASCPGLRLPHQPSPAGKGSPRAGYRARAHRTLDSPGRNGLLPQAGQTPPRVPTCPLLPGSRAQGTRPQQGVAPDLGAQQQTNTQRRIPGMGPEHSRGWPRSDSQRAPASPLQPPASALRPQEQQLKQTPARLCRDKDCAGRAQGAKSPSIKPKAAAPRELPPRQPGLSKQAAGEVMFGARAARRELLRLSPATLAGAAGPRPPLASPGSGRKNSSLQFDTLPLSHPSQLPTRCPAPPAPLRQEHHGEAAGIWELLSGKTSLTVSRDGGERNKCQLRTEVLLHQPGETRGENSSCCPPPPCPAAVPSPCCPQGRGRGSPSRFADRHTRNVLRAPQTGAPEPPASRLAPSTAPRRAPQRKGTGAPTLQEKVMPQKATSSLHKRCWAAELLLNDSADKGKYRKSSRLSAPLPRRTKAQGPRSRGYARPQADAAGPGPRREAEPGRAPRRDRAPEPAQRRRGAGGPCRCRPREAGTRAAFVPGRENGGGGTGRGAGRPPAQPPLCRSPRAAPGRAPPAPPPGPGPATRPVPRGAAPPGTRQRGASGGPAPTGPGRRARPGAGVGGGRGRGGRGPPPRPAPAAGARGARQAPAPLPRAGGGGNAESGTHRGRAPRRRAGVAVPPRGGSAARPASRGSEAGGEAPGNGRQLRAAAGSPAGGAVRSERRVGPGLAAPCSPRRSRT
ncbi:basic proline-rich protein [Caloenas nicobarica]|uniref:basic proline-rich protein n=1 Tax=Caloenas nicobarica TaxID=187106 RepID=UPI0032B72D56